MPWFTSWPESIKKRACRYLLQHYLGQFLQEKLRLDQLSVDLYNGTGYVNDVALDIWALNGMLDQAHVPMEIVDGFIGSIVVTIPWSALLSDNCKVEIKGLEVTLQPKYRTDVDHGNMTDSLYKSLGNMTTSMQLAEGCLKEEEDEAQDTSAGGLFEGLEVFAQTIETVLSKIKVSLTDMVIRVEHLPENSGTGIGLEVHIERIEYFDEITMEDKNDSSPAHEKKPQHTGDKKTVYQQESITCKHFRATGIKILMDEFPEQLRTTPPGSTGSPEARGTEPIDISHTEFETMKIIEERLDKPQKETKYDGPVVIGKFFGWQEVKLRIRQSEHVSAPKLDAECFFGSCSMFLTPHQVHLLAEFASGIATPVSVSPDPQRDEFLSMQTNNFATCHDGIKLSPTNAMTSPSDKDKEEIRKRNRQRNEDLYLANPPYQYIDEGDQFFSMEGSKLYSHVPQEAAEYENSEYGTSIYSQSTGFTPSSAYTNRSRMTPMHPSSKVMGGGHHHFGTEHAQSKYNGYGTSPHGLRRHHSSRSEEDKTTSNHCHYQFHIRAMAVTVLHINPLPPSASPTHSHKVDSSLTPQPSLESNVDSSHNSMTNCHVEMSNKYYALCETLLDETLKANKNINTLRSDLASVCCPHDHLRFTAAHIHLDSEQKTSQTSSSELSFGKAEITECLFIDAPRKSSLKSGKTKSSPVLKKKVSVHSEILVFDPKPFAGGLVKTAQSELSPDIKISINNFDSHRSSKTTLHVHLSACESEVDISIVDRLSTLLYPPDSITKAQSNAASMFSPTSYAHSLPDAYSQQAAFNEALSEDNKDRQLNLNISASFLKINFRFPIADLRPEMERRPWYNRSLRDETLILEAHDIAFLTSSLGSGGQVGSRSGQKWQTHSSSSSQQRQEFEITVKDLHVLYSDEPEKPKSFLRISQSPSVIGPLGGHVDANSGMDYPHIKVTINPSHEESNNVLLQGNTTLTEQPSPTKKKFENSDDPWLDEEFMSGSHNSSSDANPSPFSKRKVMYNSEEMILPGDSSEISAFSDHAISTSLISISIQLPAVNAFLVSKPFFENLYNRINNDILLWAPAAPRPHGKSKNLYDSRSVSYLSGSTFQIPDKGLDIASQLLVNSDEIDENMSSSCSDSDDTSTNYCRASLLGASRRTVKSVNENGMSVGKQSLISINTYIGCGRLSAKCNYICPDGSVSNSVHGEVVVMLKDANIFNVASYCGNPLLDYVCIQIKNFSLFHKADVPTLGAVLPPVERLTADAPTHLDKVLTNCEEGISSTFSGKQNQETQNMIVLAIKLQTEEARPLKQCLLAAGINGVTLHHRFTKPGQSWLEQIMDLVDATDDQVLGYKPPSFITEIHLNVKNSAAIYRPVNMFPPVSAVVTATSFSLSSNIVAGAPMSALNIIIDEAKVYITDQQNMSYVDLVYDYACVVDVNFFDMCLKLRNENSNNETGDGRNDNEPLIDFQASNNIIMLRTCADSCAALGALVQYLADDGDLATGLQDDDSISDYQSQVDMGYTEQSQQQNEPSESLYENEQNEEEDDVADQITDAMEEFFEDAVSDFNVFEAKPKSAMTESMYAFSSSSDKKERHRPSKHNDIMSQSVMMPNDFNKRKVKNRKTDVFARHSGQDFYYSAFHKPGVRHDSETPNDDDFCIIEDDFGVSQRNSEPEIAYRKCDGDFDEDTTHITLVENHFKPTGKIDQLQPPEHFPSPVMRYTLKELSCIWYMYGGSDFKTQDIPSRKNSGARAKDIPVQQQSPKSKISSSMHYNARKRTLSVGKQGSSRDSTMLMEVHLTKVRCQFEQYPEDTFEANRTVLIISDFEIKDKLQSSQINKFLYRFHSEASPRQAHAKALLVKVLQIRPEGAGTPTESRLRISLQPLRLNVDQDTLNFLTKFFSDISSAANDENGSPSHWIAPMSAYETAVGSPPSGQNHPSPKNYGTPYSSPIMTRPKPQGPNLATGTPPDNNTMLNGSSPSVKSGGSSDRSASSFPTLQPTFFREVIFSPEVPIRLDYHGKRIDTEQGTISGLLMGLGQLNCSQLKLKRVVNRHGVLGVDKLITYLLNEWAADIRANQLPLILGGVGPMHSVVQLFKGVRDLVYLPVEQYRKDGRIVRGLQRGATSFGTSTAMATLEITNRAIGLIQFAAETTYELVSPAELYRREMYAQRNWRTLGNHAIRRQPADIREGMNNALTVVKHGVEDTAGAIVRVAQQEHGRKGVTGAVGGVLRHIPPALVRPVIMATEATTNVLSGIRNQIQPDAKQQDEDKWKDMNSQEIL
uniref:autophagy-related protein 2 homolog A-like n=1 Tax=Styela clava TaxID=7725 RepID=UPI0019396E23|nr:autophagy-related protein 2 homolog A-like [Styela clava]